MKPKSEEIFGDIDQQFLILCDRLLVSSVHTRQSPLCHFSFAALSMALRGHGHCCLCLECGLGGHIYWNLSKYIIVLKTSYVINHRFHFYAL